MRKCTYSCTHLGRIPFVQSFSKPIYDNPKTGLGLKGLLNVSAKTLNLWNHMPNNVLYAKCTIFMTK